MQDIAVQQIAGRHEEMSRLRGFACPTRAVSHEELGQLTHASVSCLMQLYREAVSEFDGSLAQSVEPLSADVAGMSFEQLWNPATALLYKALMSRSFTEAGEASRHLNTAWVSTQSFSGPNTSVAPPKPDRSIKLLSLRELGDPLPGYTSLLQSGICPKLDGETEASVHEGLVLLKTWAPHYYEWISTVVRSVILLSAPPGLMLSGSHEWLWGVISMSNNQSPLSVCEMLTHEASHQYFNLACRFEPPGVPGITAFSPFKNTNRPLEKLLLAYHAFGNVALMYRSFLSQESCRVEASQRLARSLADLSQIKHIVLQRKYWTPLTHVLIEPLHAELATERS